MNEQIFAPGKPSMEEKSAVQEGLDEHYDRQEGFLEGGPRPADIITEKLFESEYQTVRELKHKRDGQMRENVIERLGDGKIVITYSNNEIVRTAIPVFAVDYMVPDQEFNPGTVYIKEQMAVVANSFPNSNRNDDEKIAEEIEKVLEEGGSFQRFYIHRDESGEFVMGYGSQSSLNHEDLFADLKDAEAYAESLAKSAEELDKPILDSRIGKITPREFHHLRQLVFDLDYRPDFDSGVRDEQNVPEGMELTPDHFLNELGDIQSWLNDKNPTGFLVSNEHWLSFSHSFNKRNRSSE